MLESPVWTADPSASNKLHFVGAMPRKYVLSGFIDIFFTTPTPRINDMKIAFPSGAPGGLDAELSAHFGHCEIFTLVNVEDSEAKEVTTTPNLPHEQGGCMGPVMLLKEAGADALVAGGMGMRPLAGFQQVGIEVFFSEGVGTVGEALQLILSGKARAFGPAQACGGGEGHDHPAH
jgi:predicted Fe-Mo cluster-binding NifX family protein